MDDLKRKKAVGSGNMSTPATTSSNASSSGYGYAPMFEALGLYSSGDAITDDMLSAALAGSSSVGLNNYTDPYSDEALGNLTKKEQLATLDDLYHPTTVLGVDVEKTAVGSGLSFLTNTLVPGGLGIPGLVASYVAKKIIEDTRTSNQLKVESYLKGTSQSYGDEMDDLGGAGSDEYPDAVTEVVKEAYAGPKVAEDASDPTNSWINDNITSNSSGSSNPAGSSTVTPGSWNNYSGTTSESSTSYSTPGSWGSSGTW